MLQAALDLAQLGYAVGAVINKVPVLPHGVHDFSSDPAKIESYFAAHPQAGIGLSAAGLLIVDIDGAHNAWPSDPDKARDLAAAPTSKTPRGGRHHFFRKPTGKTWGCTAGKLAPYVDTRSDGGYVVVSPTPGYEWIVELDRPADQLPEPPAWLQAELDANSRPAPATADSVVSGGMIPSGQRNATLASLGGTMRRRGMSAAAIEQALQAENQACCNPPLSPAEVAVIAASVSRYAPDQLAVADLAALPAAPAGGIEYPLITAAQLDSGNFDLRYLIEDVMVEKQPLVVGGGHKTLKTTLFCDAAISLASGTDFLGAFPTKKARVVFMSAESGLGTLQNSARRIAESKGLCLGDLGDNLIFSDQLPKIGDIRHHLAVEKLIRDNGTEVLAFDPLYLSLLTTDAGNLFVQGQLLREISDICQAGGVTFVALHHNKKNLVNPYAPPELADLSWSGAAEFARQWLLLSRRERYVPGSGRHLLWFSCGGSAGHSGEWCLDIDEGQAGNRIWDVRLSTAASAVQEAKTHRETIRMEAKCKQHSAKVQLIETKIVEALQASPDLRNTRRAIKERTGASPQLLDEAFSNLLQAGRIVNSQIDRDNAQSYAGFALAT